MRTVLSVVVAVALIAGALYVRGTFLDGGDGPTADGSEAPLPARDDGEVAVVCDAALGDGCPDEVDLLDTASILAAFVADEGAYDVIIAPSVIVELVEQSQSSRARFAAEREVLATSPLVLAVAPSRRGAVDAICGAAVTWACVAELVETGSLAPGLTDPTSQSDGLAALAAMTGGFFEQPAFTTNDLNGTPFLTWLDAIRGQGLINQMPLNQLILTGGAQNDSAVVVEAPALMTVSRAAQNVPDLHYPTPLAHLAVVVVGREGTDPDDVAAMAEAAAEALEAAGWRGPDGLPVVDGPPLDLDDDGLPSGGTLFALQERF